MFNFIQFVIKHIIIVWSPDITFFSTFASNSPKDSGKKGTLLFAILYFVFTHLFSNDTANLLDKLSWDLAKKFTFKGLFNLKLFKLEFSFPRQNKNFGGTRERLEKELTVQPKIVFYLFHLLQS